MYVLDSDILSLVHAGHERVGQRREDVDPADVATTVISKAEILRARCEFLLKAADAEQLLRAQYWLEQGLLPVEQRSGPIRRRSWLGRIAVRVVEAGETNHTGGTLRRRITI